MGFPRGLCFSVVGDGGGRAVLPAADCHCSPGLGRPGLGASFGLSHRRRLWARSREAGLQFGNWKNLAATGGRGSQHTEGPGSCRVSSHRAPIVRVIFRPAPGTGSRPQPSQDTLRPSALRPRQGGGSEGSAPRGKVFGRREGAEWGGMAPAEGGLQLFSKRDRRSSLLLLGRSGGSRYERSSSGFVSSGRSWRRNTEAR